MQLCENAEAIKKNAYEMQTRPSRDDNLIGIS
jgi:hypothetical protein